MVVRSDPEISPITLRDCKDTHVTSAFLLA